MEHLLATHPDVTAIATINEAALPGMQRALQTAGLQVPRDFSVTGVAARHWAEDFRPPLTAADVPIVDMGTEAVALLMESIAAPERRAASSAVQPADLAAFQHRTRAGSLTAGPSLRRRLIRGGRAAPLPTRRRG